MEAVKLNGDVITISDGVTNKGCAVYSSVRDLYDKLYHVAMQYDKAESAEQKDSLSKDMNVLAGSLTALAKSADCAATILPSEKKTGNPLSLYNVTDGEFEFYEFAYRQERKAFWRGVVMGAIPVLLVLAVVLLPRLAN